MLVTDVNIISKRVSTVTFKIVNVFTSSIVRQSCTRFLYYVFSHLFFVIQLLFAVLHILYSIMPTISAQRFHNDVLYKSAFYLLTYLLTYCRLVRRIKIALTTSQCDTMSFRDTKSRSPVSREMLVSIVWNIILCTSPSWPARQSANQMHVHHPSAFKIDRTHLSVRTTVSRDSETWYCFQRACLSVSVCGSKDI